MSDSENVNTQEPVASPCETNKHPNPPVPCKPRKQRQCARDSCCEYDECCPCPNFIHPSRCYDKPKKCVRLPRKCPPETEKKERHCPKKAKCVPCQSNDDGDLDDETTELKALLSQLQGTTDEN